ncbi:(2Fe-2S)-binding protein [Pseudomarimonas arenosa]|uniref:Bacterioferritin-associated ferredoxin n=1 Tax=Pseudomarimonas arenosa TaxID=2774145 RepID=A0AAW3ZHQ2_9GAMM|nr:(2Fe-2S)-binding protein [Pseudomarimonas arenosa]MBD8524945.1 (2Fe-2S)-binding protein [Pseudomarimonas arenosa]
MYICLCNGVSDRTVRDAARTGVKNLQELTAKTGCGACCGSCLPLAQEILEDEHGTASRAQRFESLQLAYA